MQLSHDDQIATQEGVRTMRIGATIAGARA